METAALGGVVWESSNETAVLSFIFNYFKVYFDPSEHVEVCLYQQVLVLHYTMKITAGLCIHHVSKID